MPLIFTSPVKYCGPSSMVMVTFASDLRLRKKFHAVSLLMSTLVSVMRMRSEHFDGIIDFGVAVALVLEMFFDGQLVQMDLTFVVASPFDRLHHCRKLGGRSLLRSFEGDLCDGRFFNQVNGELDAAGPF